MKKMMTYLVNALFLLGCSTSTEKTNAIKNTATVATVLAGGIPNYPTVKHQIEVDGFAICESQKFFDYSTLQVHFNDDEKLVASTDVEGTGHFMKAFSSRTGEHVATIRRRANGTALKTVHFITTEKSDRVSLNIHFCDK